MATHNDLGKLGEQLALDYFISKSYKVLEQNYRYKNAEVDIILFKDDIVIAVEVKTRSTSYFGLPEQFVTKKKIELLTKAMDNYVKKKNLDVEVRFDIISVLRTKNGFEIKHLPDAFFHF